MYLYPGPRCHMQITFTTHSNTEAHSIGNKQISRRHEICFRLVMRSITMTASMPRLKTIAAASISLVLMALPMGSNARATTSDDPSASAALGTIYFSAILDEAGLGSGGPGHLSSGGKGGGSGAGHPPGLRAGYASQSPGGSSPGKTIPGGTASGGDPIAPPPRTTEVFGDIPPSNGGTGPGSDDPNAPSTDTTLPPPKILPDLGGPYSPDEIVDLPPKVPAVVTTVRLQQVPEPTSVALFGVGLVGLGLLARRMRRSA
jgi:hypothetical protein